MSKDIQDHLKDIAESVLESGAQVSASIVGEVILDGAIGSIAPGFVIATLGYKQKRLERNIISLIEHLNTKIDVMQEKWDSLNPDKKAMIKEKFVGIICDYVIDEKQPEKIEYYANGFVSVVTENDLKEEMIIEYCDILDKLRLIELRYLIDLANGTFRLYNEQNQGIFRDDIDNQYLKIHNLSGSELSYIKNKLLNLNLLDSDRDKKNRKFSKDILRLIDNGSSRRIPRVTEPMFSDQYPLSTLGKNLLRFVMAVANEIQD